MSRILRFALVPAVLLAVVSMIGQAGDKKPAAWKTFLPEPTYVELSKRSLERIGQLAKNDKAPLTELRAEALILAGYTMSTKQTDLSDAKIKDFTTGALRTDARVLADRAGTKSTAESARKLGNQMATHGMEMLPESPKSWPALIGDIKDVMMVFANKAKGGEGIPAELQYSAKVKSQNGSEALINALAAKKLTDANVAKMAKELELVGYRVAVVGALTLERGPADKAADRKSWDEQAVVMRDSAIDLAAAAHKKDGPAIFEACKRLENSCVECHSNYK